MEKTKSRRTWRPSTDAHAEMLKRSKRLYESRHLAIKFRMERGTALEKAFHEARGARSPQEYIQDILVERLGVKRPVKTRRLKETGGGGK